MEEREEEYQRARERIFAHDVRAVCVGGKWWVGAMLYKSLCSSNDMYEFSRFLATTVHCYISVLFLFFCFCFFDGLAQI